MKRQARTFVVVAVAVITAALASFGVYRAIERLPKRPTEVPTTPVVVAAKPLPIGARLGKADLRVVSWPLKAPVTGAFAKPEELMDRGLITSVQENEPITASKVAPREAGAGLPPAIPAGMRAMSVKVNEVVGVAGFVVPGTRVDVLVTIKEEGQKDAMTRTVVGNVQVLAAGTRTDQEKAKDGKPIPTTVVTVGVLPADAERIALAANEGKITLALRNPLDTVPTATTGIRTGGLMAGQGPPPVLDRVKRRMVPAPKPANAPIVAAIYKVEAIRGAKRSEEVVR